MRTEFTKEQYGALPTDMQSVLVADGDKYVFEFEPASDVTGLKSALQKERQEAQKAKRDLESLRGVLGDKSPDDLKALLEAQRQAEENRLKQAGDWEKMKSQMLEEIQSKQIAPLTAERDRYRQAVEKHLVEAQLTMAIAQAGGFPGAEQAILPLARNYVRVIDENGELMARAWNPATDSPMVNERGENVDFKTLVEKNFRQHEIFGRLFQANGTSGSGAPSSTTNGHGHSTGKTITRAAFDALPVGEKARVATTPGIKIID